MSALGLLLGGVLTVAPVELPAYPTAALVPVGGESRLDGRLWRWGYFTTVDSLRTVAAHFRADFLRSGLPVSLAGDFVQEGAVSAFDTRARVQLSIVLRTHVGRTVGFSSVRSLDPTEASSSEVEPRFFTQSCPVARRELDAELRGPHARAGLGRGAQAASVLTAGPGGGCTAWPLSP